MGLDLTGRRRHVGEPMQRWWTTSTSSCLLCPLQRILSIDPVESRIGGVLRAGSASLPGPGTVFPHLPPCMEYVRGLSPKFRLCGVHPSQGVLPSLRGCVLLGMYGINH